VCEELFRILAVRKLEREKKNRRSGEWGGERGKKVEGLGGKRPLSHPSTPSFVDFYARPECGKAFRTGTLAAQATYRLQD